MTIVAGFSRIGNSAIAGDRLAVSSGDKFTSIPKIHQISKTIAAGYAGSYVTQTWIAKSLGPLLLKGDPYDDDYIDTVRDAWESYRVAQIAQGRGSKDEDGSLIIPGELLVVTPMAVYTCYEDGCVLHHELYGAIGSGRAYALGAMNALADPMPGVTVSSIVRSAVCAAIEHNVHCGGEVDVIEVKE